MNIYDISKLAGVSIATVSRVLNNNPNVSEQTRQKILSIMESQGYTPNAFARGLGLNTMQTVGLLCTDSSDIYQAKAIYYVEKMLRKHGYDTILCCTGTPLKSKEQSMQLLLAKKVDALVLIGSSFIYDESVKNRYIQQAGQQVPVMLLNAVLDVPNVYGVLSDDFTSVYQTTLQLIGAGVQDILFFHGATSYSGKRKLAGFRKAMEVRGNHPGALTEHMFSGSHEDISGMAQQLLELYQAGHRFQAILTSHDELALGAVKFARQAGLRIPEDLQIIGYNNSMLACCSDPELTSVDVHLELLCRRLVENLLQVLTGKEIPKQTMFPGELILRQTTNH